MIAHSIAPLLNGGASIVGWDGNGLVALEKPCGILAHPNGRGKCERALLACAYDAVDGAYVCGDGKRIFLLNRLDSPVSGILLVALSRTLAEAVKFAFKCKNVFKRYVAVAKGVPRNKCGMWTNRLCKISDGKSLKVSAGYGVIAKTRYQAIGSFRACGVTLSVLNLFPITGRTHQLRVHCAMNGLPIVGDGTYGDAKFNRTFEKVFKTGRIFLHSAEISLTYAIDSRSHHFQASSREDMMKCFEEAGS
jgi:23S rRNA-/tRNA-specific pseudouridylate synthase